MKKKKFLHLSEDIEEAAKEFIEGIKDPRDRSTIQAALHRATYIDTFVNHKSEENAKPEEILINTLLNHLYPEAFSLLVNDLSQFHKENEIQEYLSICLSKLLLKIVSSEKSDDKLVSSLRILMEEAQERKYYSNGMFNPSLDKTNKKRTEESFANLKMAVSKSHINQELADQLIGTFDLDGQSREAFFEVRT